MLFELFVFIIKREAGQAFKAQIPCLLKKKEIGTEMKKDNFGKIYEIVLVNAVTGRSTYITGSQREDGGVNLYPGYVEVALEQ